MADVPRYSVLLNPSAGGGRAPALRPALEQALRSRALTYELTETRDIEHGVGVALAAAADGILPIVASGDGLIGAVGGALAGGEVPLGVVPGGRGNDFARAMGIPTDTDAAVGLIAAGQTRRIDVGVANDRRFLCIASLGFDSDANRIANEARLIKGPLVYAYAGLRALAAWRPARFSLDLDGERLEFEGYSVAAGNTPYYGGGMKVTPAAVADDGLLEVVITRQVGKLRFLAGLRSVFRGEHIGRPEVDSFQARRVQVEADRPFDVYADGECLTRTPVTISLEPASLSVFAPTA